MIKGALEKVMSEDLSEIWTLLSGEEKRLITNNFTLHHFKKIFYIITHKYLFV